jgi:hypothetical protein
VYINNKKIGPKAPFEDYELSPGDHLLWVANPATGLDSTQTIEIIPGHQVIIHIGTPKDLYARTKTAYGIQFTEAQEAPEELEDVVLPWTLPKEEAPSKSKAQEALERELREYPSSQ